MIKTILLLLLFFNSLSVCQEISNISVTGRTTDNLLPSYNFDGSVYISLAKIVEIMGYSYLSDDIGKKVTIDFSNYELIAVANNPYLIIKSKATNKTQTFQLPTSIHFVDNTIFIPLTSSLKILNSLSDKEIFLSAAKIFLSKR